MITHFKLAFIKVQMLLIFALSFMPLNIIGATADVTAVFQLIMAVIGSAVAIKKGINEFFKKEPKPEKFEQFLPNPEKNLTNEQTKSDTTINQ